MRARALAVSSALTALALGGALAPLPGVAATSPPWVLASVGTSGPGNGRSSDLALSGPGDVLVFASESTNLVDSVTMPWQVYARDAEGVLSLVSGADGAPPDGEAWMHDREAVSEDGTRVLFGSSSTNLTSALSTGQPGLYVKDLTSGSITLVNIGPEGNPLEIWWGSPAALSGDGTTVAFLADPGGGELAILVHDLETGSTTVLPGPVSEGPVSLTRAGSYVAYLDCEEESEPCQVWIAGVQTGERVLVSSTDDGEPADDDAFDPQVSSGGARVLFRSRASNLPGGDGETLQTYIKQVATGELTLVSVDSHGNPAQESIQEAAFSASGRIVALATRAALRPDDDDDTTDVYVWDLNQERLALLGSGNPESEDTWHDATVDDLEISSDGSTVAFTTEAGLVMESDGTRHAYLADVSFNVPPVLDGISVWTDRDTPAEVVLTAFDDDGDDLTFEVVTPPTHGALDDCTAGTCTYTPASDYVGADEFAVRAFDGHAWSPTVTVPVQVGEPGRLTVASMAAGGFASNDHSSAPSLSADGRYVAFESWASNLHPDAPDTDGRVYLRDLQTGELTLEAPGRSPSLSADGRYLAFYSVAQLVPEDQDDVVDVYVKNMANGSYRLASVGPAGKADAGGLGTLTMYGVALSADASRVAFTSTATNLHPEDSEASEDIYAKDLDGVGTLHLVSSDASGQKVPGWNYSPSISGDGRLIAFVSWEPESGKSTIYLKNLDTQALTVVAQDDSRWSADPFVSADGSTISFVSAPLTMGPEDEADPDRHSGIYLYDVASGQVRLGSTNADGDKLLFDHSQARSPLTADASQMVFRSHAPNIHADPSIALAGHVYVKDLVTGAVTLVSVSAAGVPSDGYRGVGAISADGSTVAFVSNASNLYHLIRPSWQWPPTPEVYVYRLGTLAEPADDADGDGDGVHDAIDDGDGTFRDGVTYGQVLDTAGQTVLVEPTGQAGRVRITVSGDGSGIVRVAACGMQLYMPAPSQVIIECGSLLIQVVEGPVEVVLSGGVTVTVPVGVIVYIDDLGDGAYVLEHREGSNPVTVTVGGTVREVAPGATARSWHMSAFDAPVSPLPAVNSAKAGSTVPMKWRMTDAEGAPVTTVTSVSITGQPVSCTSYVPVGDPLVIASSVAVQQQGSGRYHLNWKTPKTLAPGCILVTVATEGAEQAAMFNFR